MAHPTQFLLLLSASGETWLILGASSALARALAREAASRRAAIILAGRDTDDLARTANDIRIEYDVSVSSIPFDARDFASHAGIAATMADIPGILNVAVLFGIMPDQASMDADIPQALACIDTGFTGAVSILHHLAPEMERRRGGVVMGFGSVAGDRGRLKNYVYGATKSGLHTYLAGLRNRLGRHGVHVMTVKPGFVDTAMTFGLPGMFLVAQPDTVARACLDAAAKRRDIVYVPWFWQAIMAIIRAIPERIFKKLSI
jgi:short-subunit dehydrogenase